MEPVTETSNFIAASKVTGTAVYSSAGGKLGSIHDLLIDKVSGRVMYVIMSFGGFLGIGNDYHPLPWSALQYGPDLGGYLLRNERDNLEGAPSYPVGTEPNWADQQFATRVDEYWR